MSWWTEARFGLFLHWGLYSLAARHEWVRNREHISDEDYRKYFEVFDPDLYDPRAWAKSARAAGMKYFVVTTKHHEGFCLWDSRSTAYKATNTPCGRDLIRPLVEAMRAEGLRVGFYHSLLDWHHPDYPLDREHPLAGDAAFREAVRDRDVRKYAAYLHGQVRELLTEYGAIDLLFFDFSFPGRDGKGRDDWQSEKLLSMVRGLQPDILVNDRLDLLDVPGGWDYRTPEQFMPPEGMKKDGLSVPWETCQTFSGSWGYHRDESTWKSVRQLVVRLIETVSKGGNLLLNVGPTARGTFDDRALERLDGIGAWMGTNSRSIYGCTEAPPDLPRPASSLLTYNPKSRRIYVHVLEWPPGLLRLEGFAGRVRYAQLLHDASEIPFTEEGRPKDLGYMGFLPGQDLPGPDRATVFRLPVRAPRTEVPVLELFLK